MESPDFHGRTQKGPRTHEILINQQAGFYANKKNMATYDSYLLPGGRVRLGTNE
jgi:hypothetical protein